MPCDCSTKSIDGQQTPTCEAAAYWLDERNSVRAAYLSNLISGSSISALNGSKLAESYDELYENALRQPKDTIADLPMIQNSDQLHDFLFADKVGVEHLLRDQDQTVKEEFFSKCDFVDEESVDGRRRYVSTFYFGTLIEKIGLPYEEIFKVAMIFGISPKLFLLTNNRFGQICSDGSRGCQMRAGYSCSGRLC